THTSAQPHAWQSRSDLRVGGQRSVPFELEVGHPVQVQPPRGTQAAAIAPTRPRERVVAQPRAEARITRRCLACLDPAEKGRERLVDAAQHVLAGREVGYAKVAGRTNLLQLVGLFVVAKADAVHAPRRAALV